MKRWLNYGFHDYSKLLISAPFITDHDYICFAPKTKR